MVSVAAIILTYNEETQIAQCLESLVGWCSEIWVVDSYSTDNTLDVCRRYTENIVQREFNGYGKTRNWALDNLPINSDWIFFVDADERVTPKLRDEIIDILSNEQNVFDGFYIPFAQVFWGRWLRHGEAWPNYVLRLFKKGKGRYDENQLVHEYVKLNGRVGYLKNPMIHISRSSMSEALRKLNTYTDLDAIRMYKSGEGLYPRKPWDPPSKKILKSLFELLPLKPLVKFIWDYIILQGFRDGYIGFVWAYLQAVYVYTAYFKYWELRTGLVTINSFMDDQIGKRTAV